MDDIESQLPLTHDYSRSMTKRTKKIVQDGCAHLKRQRQAFAACLQTAVNESQDPEVVDWFNTPTRPLLAIVPKSHTWIKSINNAHIIGVDDWIHGAYPHGDFIRAISEKIEKLKPSLVFSFLGKDCPLCHDDCEDYFDLLDSYRSRDIAVLHVDSQFNMRWHDDLR